MPLYSPGRRRAIILLLLSSILIITLDMRGNALLNAARTAWTEALSPFESAAEVVARPIRNAWRGITRYDDLEAENRQLREQIEAQRSDNVQARSFLSKYYELLANEGLEVPGDYELVMAPVVGQLPSNLDQTIEIDRGTDAGIANGMPVLSSGGGFLIGRVIRATESRATVRLITDTSYYLNVKIVRPEGELPDVQFNVITTTTTSTTTTTTIDPNVSIPEGIDTTTSTAPPPTSTPPASTPPATPPPDPETGDGSAPAVTTTLPQPAQRETGQLHGLGPGQPLEITLVTDDPARGTPEPGDVIMTSGGALSLAPADIPIGIVSEVDNVSPVDGLRLRVLPFADLDSFELVQVMLYQPDSESSDG